MKTSGLTLQEALQALVDGKARAASHPNSDSYLIFNCEENYFVWEGVHIGCTFASDQLTPEWSLIDPVQEYEEVEVVSWGVSYENMRLLGYSSEKKANEYASQFNDSRVFKLTGIDRVPKKEKVMRRVEVGAGVASDGDVWGITNNSPFKDRPETHGKTGKLIFEWEE